MPVLDPVAKKFETGWIWRPPETLEPLPDEWMNPLTGEVFPREQDERGTCTGMAGAEANELKHMELTKERPTEEDRKNYQVNVTEQSGIRHDKLSLLSRSAECCYQWGREEGHVTAPSGGYIIAVCKANVKRGNVYEDMWPTSKTVRAVYSTPPLPGMVETEAPLHKWDGFAEVLSMDAMKRGLMQYGCLLVSIDVYENYSTMAGGDGTWPAPKGEIVGAHALCVVGWNKSGFIHLHSWGKWCGKPHGSKDPKPMLGLIPYSYWETAGLQAFMPIDASEVARLKPLHQKVVITPNLRCNIYLGIGGEAKGYKGSVEANESLTLWLENPPAGKEYVIDGEAIDYFNLHAVAVGPFLEQVALTFTIPQDTFWVKFLRWLGSLK